MTPPPTQQNDVRMRGFSSRTLVETAWEWIDTQAGSLDAQSIDYQLAHNRVLAADILATIDVPSFDRSAMDGYALRGAETNGAGDYNPLTFRIEGESMPGRPFAGEVVPGTAVRIMTGSPMPQGADAVVPAEYAHEVDGQVTITTSVAPGKHVGHTGEDIRQGSRLFAEGRRLRPQDVALLASIGICRVDVVRHPNVRLVVTGNELVPPGQTKGEYQIYESNSSMLSALAKRDGAELESHHHVEDAEAAVRNAMLAPGADVVIVSGGSSVGKEDLAPSILAAEGELAIHGIAMRPSSPAGMGKIGKSLVFLVPGNPVSCLCAYDFFAGRAIRLMGGRGTHWPYAVRRATIAKKIVSAVGRVDYCRVRFEQDQVEPLALSGASILSSTTRADGFVIVPAEREGYAPGSNVDVFLYDPVN